MRPNPQFASTDVEVVRQLIRENPWATIVSSTDEGLVASHYPILLEEGSEQLVVVSHVGRPDDLVHGLGNSETLLIVQGRHGYVSPSWYVAGVAPIPTWNFSVAHCYGIPEILDERENLRVLARLMDHFERQVDEPAVLEKQEAARIAKGTVGFRMTITRFICKVKLSQNKDVASQRQVIAALRAPGPYQHPGLADDMQRVLFGDAR
jgi:transcriptional regulator